jgi:hypothetical protein
VVLLNKSETDQIYEFKFRLNKRFYYKINNETRYISLNEVIKRYRNFTYTFIKTDIHFSRERNEKKNLIITIITRRNNINRVNVSLTFTLITRININSVLFFEKYKDLSRLIKQIKKDYDN